MTAWHRTTFAAYDIETTGTSVEDDRIVTACIALIDGSGKTKPEVLDAVVDPGIDIPTAASNIHHWTTERVRTHPGTMPARDGVDFIADMLAKFLLVDVATTGMAAPIIAHNAPFDLTMLDRECRRHSLPTLEVRLGGRSLFVIDTYVLSKHLDPYRKKPPAAADGKQAGAHTLEACARAFGVPWEDEKAHSSDYDALVAARVAWQMAERNPRLARMTLPELQRLQTAEKKKQDASLAAYFRKIGKPFDGLDGHWPIAPFEDNVQQAIA